MGVLCWQIEHKGGGPHGPALDNEIASLKLPLKSEFKRIFSGNLRLDDEEDRSSFGPVVMTKGDVPGSELETDEVPASVAVKVSGLLEGVTRGPRAGFGEPLKSPRFLEDGFVWSEVVDSGSLRAELTRFRRRTFGWARFMTTMLHWSSSKQRFSSCLRIINIVKLKDHLRTRIRDVRFLLCTRTS
ncbi:SRSF protein kinase 3 [Striga asiatica]|uniref:SRSF protein kinase 3 n=1 Tax=Striga asiatica TaxID=4170 RepID=A0A5A7R7V3_STRAF|nr:SRSF protein kinase 3 [Striga asiatica]